jgi:hypothetical protein
MRNQAQTTLSETEAEIGAAVVLVVHVERQPGSRILRELLALGGGESARARAKVRGSSFSGSL